MNPNRKPLVALTAALGCLLAGFTAPAASTPGDATLRVTTSTYGGKYAPKHVLAIWVTDARTNFVNTIKRRANAQRAELDRWMAALHGWDWQQAVDGTSGATLSAHTTHVTTWTNCVGTNGVTVPDGTYIFWVEFSEHETTTGNLGKFTSAGIPFVKGTVPLTNTYANYPNFTGLQVTYLPRLVRDIAVTRIAPGVGPTDASVPVTVTVTNKTGVPASFSVTLSNATSGTLLGSLAVADLAGNVATNLVFTWNTAGLATGDYILVARAGPALNEAVLADNTLARGFTLRAPTHDIAVHNLLAPAAVSVNSRTNVTVIVTNKGDFAESFAVVLTDDTDGRAIGSNWVSTVAALTDANISFSWDTTNAAWGAHTLRAVAGPVAGETALADNTNSLSVLVLPPMETNVFIAKGSVWRYFDQGVDLTDTPWKEPDYYDGVWKRGPGPLGYSADGQHTNIATVLSWGPSATNKYPTCYFRKEFFADAAPMTLTLNVRRDDGVIFYLNGAELVRMNAPAGPVRYSDFFPANPVDGANQYFYFTTNVPVTNGVAGRNVLAAELHQASPSDPDAVLDVELVGAFPMFDRVHDVAALALTAPADALAGDRIPITVTLTNRGNAIETGLVIVKDTLTGAVLGSQTFANLVPGGTTTTVLNWSALGATAGMHGLQACTVVGGVTNLSGVASGAAFISGTGFVTNTVNVAGTLGGRCATLTTTSNLLLVGAGATLEVWHRADPAAPVRLGAVRLPGLIEQIAVGGQWAYVACGAAGVQFVDLSVPAVPLQRLTYDTSGHACGVAVNTNNTLLYVADGAAGVRLVNIANPLAPTLAGVIYTEGPARALAVKSTYLYLLDEHQGLRIYNTANPAAPVGVGTNALVTAGRAIALAGDYAYVVDANNRFYVLAVGNTLNPALSGTLLLTNRLGQGLALSGATAYVAAGDGGLLVINAATPSAPALLAALPAPGEASAVAVAGSTLYLANGFAGFQVYNIAAPASPVLQADLPTALRASEVVVSNGLAYVAAGEAGLRIFAITNPTAPVLRGVFTGAANARALALSGVTAYVGDGQYGLKVVSVADPETPTLLSSYTSPDLGFIRNVAAAGALVLLSDGRRVELVDASDPAHPVRRASYNPPTFAFSVTVSGSHAYLACGEAGVVVLQIAPAALTQVGTFDTPGLATGVAVSGSLAHVADGAQGWLVLDVSNPTAPVPLGPPAIGGPVVDVAVSGVLATLANGANLAVQVDASTPLTPVTRKVFSGLVRALRMAASGEQTFVAEDEAGLAILDSSADTDRDGLADGWEQQLVDANPADRLRSILDVRPGDDLDGDGASNLAEYLAGTDPTDPASRFVLFIPANSGGPVTLRWTTVPGRLYTVHRTSDLGAGFTPLPGAVDLPASQTSYTDPNPPNPAFYIISVR